MILARSPLRITLGGGGTDLEPYCSEHGCFCLAAAINQYVYVSVSRPFSPGIYLKYSQVEHVEQIEDVQHPIIRHALWELGIPPQIEITTLADIPAGTGLGSSSSFTAALLMALIAYQRKRIGRRQLAQLAITIEKRTVLTGLQDQYAAVYGGLSVISPHGRRALGLPHAAEQHLRDRLLLFYTDIPHDAAAILAGQGLAQENLHRVKRAGVHMHSTLKHHEWYAVGSRLNEQWLLKEERCPSPQSIHQLRERARHNGATGVKLIGAGGGGFLLCATEHPLQLRRAMAQVPLTEVRYEWDYEGTKILLS